MEDTAVVNKTDGKLAAFASALRRKMNERGLSGSVVAKLVVPASVANFELGWGFSMDEGDEVSGELGKEESAAVENVDTFLDISNDVKRKALKWKVPMSVTIEMLIGFVKLEATLDISPSAEERDNKLEEILAADWGNMNYSDTNAFIILKSHLVHREGKPVNNAMSKWSFVRSVSNRFDRMKENMILSSKSMQAHGYHGSLIAGVEVQVPPALTFGLNVFSIKVGVEIGLTDLIAAQQVWLEDDKIRTSGKLNVEAMDGQGIPKMDTFGSCDPYLVVSVEGGKKEDKRRTLTQKNTLTPEWNEILSPMPCAQKGESLVVSLYDYDNGTSDEFIDEWIIPLDKLELIPGQSKMLICPLKGKKADESSIRIKVWWSPA